MHKIKKDNKNIIYRVIEVFTFKIKIFKNLFNKTIKAVINNI